MKLSRIAPFILFLFAILPSQARATDVYVGIFGGTAHFSDTSATAVNQQLLCVFSPCNSITAIDNIYLGDGTAYGIRAGLWFESYPYFGMAVEYISANNSSASLPAGNSGRVNYTTFALTPMVRLPLFQTETQPNGHINLYGGVALSRDCTKLTVYSSKLSSPGTIDNCDTPQPTLNPLFGIAFNYGNYSLFIEQRQVKSKIDIKGLFYTRNAEVEMTMSTVGLAYSF